MQCIKAVKNDQDVQENLFYQNKIHYFVVERYQHPLICHFFKLKAPNYFFNKKKCVFLMFWPHIAFWSMHKRFSFLSLIL